IRKIRHGRARGDHGAGAGAGRDRSCGADPAAALRAGDGGGGVRVGELGAVPLALPAADGAAAAEGARMMLALVVLVLGQDAVARPLAPPDPHRVRQDDAAHAASREGAPLPGRHVAGLLHPRLALPALSLTLPGPPAKS